jgi:hypothetical protein
LGALALAFALGSEITENSSDDWKSGVALVGSALAFAALPFTSSLGAYQVGSHVDPGGSYLGSWGLALGGSAVGAVAGIEIGVATHWSNDGNGVWWWAIPTAIMLGGVAGSVTGYNLFRVPGQAHAWQERIGLPSVAVLPERTRGGTGTCLEARLVSFRF